MYRIWLLVYRFHMKVFTGFNKKFIAVFGMFYKPNNEMNIL